MNVRFILAIWIGKCASLFLKILGSEGETLPGLLAERICPNFLAIASKLCSDGVILVCGTNGKTTTSRMIATLLQEKDIIYNRSGSNLIRGHVAAFLSGLTLSGNMKAKVGLLEVDEAALPEAIRLTQPKVILMHNLFRDQLDRYGEIDSIAKKWQLAVQQWLPKTSTLIVNADDPNLAFLAQKSPQECIYYGLNDSDLGTKNPTSAVDAYFSPASGIPLTYTHYYLSHLGDYTDQQGFSRPKLSVAAEHIHLDSTLKQSEFTITTKQGTYPVSLTLPGVYNVYNALAAIVVASEEGISPERIKERLLSFTSVFGRFERFEYAGKTITLCLIKNPAGASEVIRTIASSTDSFNLGFFMNDNFADGTDVSWYWDTPYEELTNRSSSIVCSGKRAEDIALRLKYAGETQTITCTPSITTAFDVLAATNTSSCYILSTYTATLELQHILRKRKIKAAYWQE